MRNSLILLALALFPFPVAAQHVSVRVQVIDRGQADGILIRTPNDQWVVIDAGTNRAQAEAMRDVWGVDEVALAIVSHRHRDHYDGMDDVLNLFDVGRLVMSLPDCPGRVRDDAIRAIATQNGVPMQSRGADTLNVDGVRFIILPDDPAIHACPDEENNNSIVVKMEYGAFSMLFAGDAETEERTFLMQNHSDLLDATVLKASHHGSRNGADGIVDGDPWIEHVDPSAVLLTASEGSQFGHPHTGAMDAYETHVGTNRVYCTSRMGTLRVYGRQDGGFSVWKQTPFSGSCRF